MPLPRRDEKAAARNQNYRLLSKKQLVEQLGFESEEDWLVWLQSDLFKPHWSELWDDYMKNVCGRKRSYGPPTMLQHVQTRIEVGEANGKHAFSRPRGEVDKTRWTTVDHLARFIYMVRHDNETNPKGVFFNKGNSTAHNTWLLWNLLKLLQSLHRPPHINRPNGGNAIMGNTKPKAQRRPTEQSEKDGPNAEGKEGQGSD